MKKGFAIIFLWICCCNFSISQNLTQQEMLEDISFLQNLMYRHCSFLPLLQERTGTNVESEFELIRNRVEEVKTKDDFVKVVNQALQIVNDGHTHLVTNKQLVKAYFSGGDYYQTYVSNVSLADTIDVEKNYSIVSDSIYAKALYGIRTKYLNGRYYNLRPFLVNDTVVESGSEITEIDNIPIHQFINDNRVLLDGSEWDPINKQWYNELFFISLPQIDKCNFTLTIDNRVIALECNKTVEFIKKEYNQAARPKVSVIGDILYIYMPQMAHAEWYVAELHKKFSKNINKIVIDVRNNGGGSDMVWQTLLRNIMDRPLEYRFYVGFNHNELLEKPLGKFGKIENNGNVSTVENLVRLLPTDNTVAFQGEIYVLQDKYSYSAASSLASVAMQQENMHLIGEPNRYIGGYGFPALIFKLPHSGIVFHLAFTTDLSGGKDNPYMDKVQVLIREDDPKEYCNRLLNDDFRSEEYLLHKDNLMKYVRDHF